MFCQSVKCFAFLMFIYMSYLLLIQINCVGNIFILIITVDYYVVTAIKKIHPKYAATPPI